MHSVWLEKPKEILSAPPKQKGKGHRVLTDIAAVMVRLDHGFSLHDLRSGMQNIAMVSLSRWLSTTQEFRGSIMSGKQVNSRAQHGSSCWVSCASVKHICFC
ncbi:hypothetical protein Lal_00004267 [Lupinus albus]|nr:hypothetical protein Lal_00004267 [Lupinus albus]